MEQDKTRTKKIQEYYDLSCNYLESAIKIGFSLLFLVNVGI
jgi:hypothetical protein